MSSPDKDIFIINSQPFLRTFSYREVLSAFMVALMLLAGIYVLRYLGIEMNAFLIGVSALAAVLLLHGVYRLEHKRSNDYIGRVIHDALYLIMLVLLRIILGWYTTGSFSIDMENPIVALFLIWLMLMVLEGLVALLLHVFELLRWRIL